VLAIPVLSLRGNFNKSENPNAAGEVSWSFNKYFGNSLFPPGPVGAVSKRTGSCQEITELNS